MRMLSVAAQFNNEGHIEPIGGNAGIPSNPGIVRWCTLRKLYAHGVNLVSVIERHVKTVPAVRNPTHKETY